MVTSPTEDRATLPLKNMCRCPMTMFEQVHSQSSTLVMAYNQEKNNLNFFLNSRKGKYGYQFLNFVLFNQSCKQKSHFVERNLICVSRHCFRIQNLGSSDL